MGRDFFNEGRDNGQGVSGVSSRGNGWHHGDAIMEVRGRNGKWLGAGNRRTVGNIGLIVLLKLHARIEECGGGHVCIGYKYSNRSRRGPVNGKEGADGRELAADFFFLNVEEAGDVFDHLFMGQDRFIAGRAVRRRGGDDVGGVASTVGGRRQAGRDEDGRG